MSAKDTCLATERCATWRRRAARAWVLVSVCLLLIQLAPKSWTWLAEPKRALAVALGRVGLRQGEWAMFAPDPVLNNGWFTAELQHADGTQTQWSSPYWIEADSSQKFLQFRFLNYFNRLPDLANYAAREDFVDYLARQSSVPVESIKLYHTRMRLIMPDDGTLPKRDEVDWMFSSALVAKRRYSQSGPRQGAMPQPHLPWHSPQP